MNNTEIDEDEIDLKEIFRTIFRYKVMIIALVIITTAISAYIAYFKPNVYKASSTVEVGIERSGGYSGQDVLSMAMSPGTVNADTEMGIIRSRFLAEKAAKDVDLLHGYYTARRFKEIELYKQSPFKVGMLKGYGLSFDLYPLDDKTYRLVVKKMKDENGTDWSYDEVLPYGEEIDSEHFHLNVVKTGKMNDPQYRFVIYDPKDAGLIGQNGVGVAQLSKFSAILEISYEDNVALRAQEFANALAKAYLQQNIEKKTKEATRKLKFIDKQLKRITENLKSSAVKLEEFKKSSSTISLSAKAETVIRQMSEKESKLAAISIEQEMLASLYKKVKSGKNLEGLAYTGMDADSSNSPLATMIKELQETIVKKKVLSAEYTEVYREVVKLKRAIEQDKKIIISTIENMDKNIREREALLEKSIAEQQKELDKLPADERMFGDLQRKFSVNEKIYSYLLEKRSETAILKAATVSKNRIIDTALTPHFPIKPKRKLIVLVGIILGLILGIALAFLRAFLDDRIRSEEDISHATQIPLLGIIPHIKNTKETLNVVSSPKSAVAESFRHLRTNLQFMESKKGSHIISITSTIGGEGKTTIGMNLAAIMSMADKKTILLNMDMRKPTLHERFGIENTKGMSTLLSKHTSLGSVIQHTEYKDLDVITSGPVPPNPSELIQGELMEQVLEKLSEVYDIIIMDTPPVGLVTDARTLMHLSDTSIYVLRAEYSKKGFLRGIEQLYQHKEMKGLGILLNDLKVSRDGYGYGYGYGYYEEDGK